MQLRHKPGIFLALWFCYLLITLGAGCSPSEDSADDSHKADSSLSRMYKFTSDTNHYFSTSHEGKFVSNTDYLYKPNLENIPFQLGDWEGEDLDSNDPNILYHRLYGNPKTNVQFT